MILSATSIFSYFFCFHVYIMTHIFDSVQFCPPIPSYLSINYGSLCFSLSNDKNLRTKKDDSWTKQSRIFPYDIIQINKTFSKTSVLKAKVAIGLFFRYSLIS